MTEPQQVDPPKKALHFTLDLDGHDRSHLAESLRELAWEIETEKSIASTSSRGWWWKIEQRSELTPDEYEAALLEWWRAQRLSRQSP